MKTSRLKHNITQNNIKTQIRKQDIPVKKTKTVRQKLPNKATEDKVSSEILLYSFSVGYLLLGTEPTLECG